MGRVVRKINTDGVDSGALNDSDVLISYAGCGCAGGLETTILGELVPRDDTTGNARRKQKVYADILGRTFKTETYEWENGAVYSTVVNSFNQRDQVLRSRQFAGDDSSSTYQDTLAIFDGHGRLSASHRPEQRDSSNNPAYTTYTYNADDSIATVTDARGAVTHYTYENVGGTPKRPLVTGISWSVPQGSGISVPTAVSYSFDNAGNRIGMTDALGTVAYTYDELSRMTSEARNFSDTLADEPASGVYEVQYTYGLAGDLLSYTDPFGEEIEYSNDKLGRLSSVTGSSFGGVTSYASNPGYRAWGALKSLSYSNGYEMQITFDDRLRASEYDYKKPSDPYAWKRNKDYEYYSDGRLKLADENGLSANNRFDRSFTYDHQGRVKEAKSGVEAHGGTETQLMHLPYRQTYNFTPFGQIESRDSLLWNYGDWDFNYTYQNNRRAGGQHDADGRETYGNSTHYEFDASGGLVGTNRSQSFDADIVRDGNGREGKRSQKLWDEEEEEWGEVKSTYQIFSSVLGRTVSEADTTGKKWRTFVIVAGAEIARQAITETDDEAVTLVHTDASGYSTHSMSIGTGFAHDTQAMKTEELDGLGNNVGTFGSMSRPPYSGGVMDSANDSVTIDDVTMGDCELDGMITPCSMVNRMAGSGALQLEVRYHGPNGFSYRYHDFDNSLPGRHSMSIFVPDYNGYGSEPEVVPDEAPLPPPPLPFVPTGTWYTLNVSWDTRAPALANQTNAASDLFYQAINDALEALKKPKCRELFGSGMDPENELLRYADYPSPVLGTITFTDLGPYKPVLDSDGRPTGHLTAIAGQTTGKLGSYLNSAGVRISKFVGADIKINSNNSGPFVSGFKDFLGVGAADRTYRALTIIHELGHVLRILFGSDASPIESDSDSGEINRNNSKLVYDACFSSE